MLNVLSLSPRSQPCPADGPSYRAVQCSAFDATPYKGDNHTWLPVQMKSTKPWQNRLSATTFLVFILFARIPDLFFFKTLLLLLHFLHCVCVGAPCQLHCKPEGQFFSVMLSDSVVDGTPCNPGTRDMCINGVCRVRMK